MTEQLKAEAYVRSQRPALMELTFGCEVIFNKIKRDVYATRRKQKEVYIQRVMDFTWVPIEKIEIIGHSINLQDWVAALGEKNIVLIDIVIGGDIAKASVGETYITFNLTTGQPNSPEDYKAFNDITSI